MSYISIIVLIAIIGFGSHYFAKDDNEVEQVAEEVLDDTIEVALHLPADSVHIDLSPEHEEE